MIAPEITDEIFSDGEGDTAKTLPSRQATHLLVGSSSLAFDIETGPAEIETIRSLSKPYEPPPPPGDFDPATVKTGNLKDPGKIMAKVAEARQAHATAVKLHANKLANQEVEYWADLQEKAPLSPLVGRVLAIGVGDAVGNVSMKSVLRHHDDFGEAELLDWFWSEIFTPTVRQGRQLIGHNILDFDVPFLVRRSWILGVDVPPPVMSPNYRYAGDCWLDTRKVWECGTRGSNVPGNLDVLGRAFDLGGKTEGMSGSDFWKLFHTESPDDREKAMEYLARDVYLTVDVARQFGLM